MSTVNKDEGRDISLFLGTYSYDLKLGSAVINEPFCSCFLTNSALLTQPQNIWGCFKIFKDKYYVYIQGQK